MERPKVNPFAKQHFNLTEQMIVTREDPTLAKQLEAEAVHLDAELERKQKTRTVAEFNELDKDGKINFIRGGGEVK